MIYSSHFHSIMEYGIIFWGNSPVNRKVFQSQKKIKRIITWSTSKTSCKSLFRILKILTMPSQYILSVMNFLVNKLEYFTFNISIHAINTRRRVQLYKPLPNLTSYHRGVYYASIKTFNALPIQLYCKTSNKKAVLQSRFKKKFCLINTSTQMMNILTYLHQVRIDNVI
jgi:hypothetical protein